MAQAESTQARHGVLSGGLAMAADWLSGAVVLALFGMQMMLGHDGLTLLAGLMAGLALAGVVIAPHLNRAQQAGSIAFLGARYGAMTRMAGLLVAAAATGLLLAANAMALAQAVAMIRPSGANAVMAVGLTLLVFMMGAVLAGVRAISEAQAAAYPLLLAAVILPLALVAMAGGFAGSPLTPVTMGKVLQDITALELQLLEKGLADPVTLKPFARPFISATPSSALMLTLSVGLGLAVMPHVLLRPAMARTRDGARSMVAVALVLILFAVLALPPLAAAARHAMLAKVAGSDVNALPAWLIELGTRGLVNVCGVAATSLEAVSQACRSLPDAPGVLRLDDIELARDGLLWAVPGLLGLPLSSVNGLALGIGLGSLLAASWLGAALAGRAAGHGDAPAGWRVAALLACVAAATLAALVALSRAADIATLLCWGLAVAAAGLAPALLAGIWWRRASAAGAVAGLVTGCALTVYYIAATRYFAPEFFEMWRAASSAGYGGIADYEAAKEALAAAEAMDRPVAREAVHEAARAIANWWGLRDVAAGVLGAAVGLVVLVLVSLVTPATKAPAVAVIEMIRDPHESV